MKLILAFMFSVSLAFAEWIMFSDGVDTYLYNNQNGVVYIKVKSGGKNYEDKFVRMQAGVDINTSPKKAESNQNIDAINKAQELLRNSIDSSSMIQ